MVSSTAIRRALNMSPQHGRKYPDMSLEIVNRTKPSKWEMNIISNHGMNIKNCIYLFYHVLSYPVMFICADPATDYVVHVLYSIKLSRIPCKCPMDMYHFVIFWTSLPPKHREMLRNHRMVQLRRSIIQHTLELSYSSKVYLEQVTQILQKYLN